MVGALSHACAAGGASGSLEPSGQAPCPFTVPSGILTHQVVGGGGLEPSDLTLIQRALCLSYRPPEAVTGEAPAGFPRKDRDAQPARAWMMAHHARTPKRPPRRLVPQAEILRNPPSSLPCYLALVSLHTGT
jgi:hypothetical protein